MTRQKSKQPTEIQQRLLAYIDKYAAEQGYCPSYREMQSRVGISSISMVKYNLEHLERLGYIERDANTSRSIRVVKPFVPQSAWSIQTRSQAMLSIPVVGRIVASQPVPVPGSDFNYFDTEERVEIALSLLSVKSTEINNLFALQVQGDSMIDALVSDGDWVIMQPVQAPQNGDMVAVWLPDENEVTLKHFYKEPDRIRLQPANPTMGPIYISKTTPIEFQGKVLLIITPVKPPRSPQRLKS